MAMKNEFCLISIMIFPASCFVGFFLFSLARLSPLSLHRHCFNMPKFPVRFQSSQKMPFNRRGLRSHSGHGCFSIQDAKMGKKCAIYGLPRFIARMFIVRTFGTHPTTYVAHIMACMIQLSSRNFRSMERGWLAI